MNISNKTCAKKEHHTIYWYQASSKYVIQKTVHARLCHWLETTALFAANVAAWSTAQTNGDVRLRRLMSVPQMSTARVSKLRPAFQIHTSKHINLPHEACWW